MLNSKTEIAEIMANLSPDNQHILLLCARMASAAEGSGDAWRTRISARRWEGGLPMP